MKSIFALVLFYIPIFGAFFQASAQTQGSLVGSVLDSTRGAIVGAKIKAMHEGMGISFFTSTNSAGDYIFEELPVGRYSLTVTAPKFREIRFEGIQIHVATVLRQDAVLAPAPVETNVEVQSSTPQLLTETAQISKLVGSREITDLPLNGRNIFSLLTLAPGAESGSSPVARFTTVDRPALAGGRAGYTVFRVGGINVNSQNLPSASIVPGVDAVQEFRAATQVAPASLSSTSTVSVAIRSGSSNFHGTVYEFLRNNALDAHPFFERDLVTRNFRTTPDQLHFNQFGGALGGPIRKDRTFFFLNVQLTQNRMMSQVTGLYPSARMLTGDFSGVNPLSGAATRNFGPIMDPQTGSPFPDNQIPASRFSSFASKFLPAAFLPANCLACLSEGLGFNFVGRQPSNLSGNQIITRIDHRFRDSDSIFGVLQIEPVEQVTKPSPNPISAMDTPTRSYLGSIDEVHIFSPSLVNEFRVGYVRSRATLQQEADAKGAFSFQNTPSSLPSLFPTIALAGYPNLFGNGAISDRNMALDESWNANEQLSWVHGTHELQAGFELTRAHFWNTLNFNAYFVYADNLSPALGFTGSSFADFLLGTPLVGLTFQGTGKADMVERSVYAGYLQDTWRASNRLTINYGMRYEFPQRWHDRNSSLNRLGTLDMSPASLAMGGRFLLGGSPNYYVPGQGVVQGTGSPLIRGALVDPAWHDFQPRVGLAYRPFAGNSTVFRAGFGVYFALQDANSLAFEMLSPPFLYQNLITNLPPAVPLGHPLHDNQFWPTALPNGVATEGNDPRNRDPRMYQWTASIEHEIGHGLVFSAEYLGNHGLKNPFTTLPNSPALPDAAELALLEKNPTLNVPLATKRAPVPNVALGYQYIQNVAQSWYQALNLRAEGHFGPNLTLSAAYTWSKALDMASAEQQLPGVASNLGLGKSYADFDHPQRFVASWIYELPFGRWVRPGFWRNLVGGWESTGIATFEAGPPYTIQMGVDTSFTGGAAPVYPDLIGPLVRQDIRQSNGIYLTPQNLIAPPFGTYGALARNAFHGPGINNFDLGIFKNLAVNERFHLQLRGELFNAFNHAQFSFAGSSLASSIAAPSAGSSIATVQYVDPSQFGRVTARAPRIVQAGVKLIF